MNQAMNGFFFGVVIGVFAGVLLIGLFFSFRKRAQEEKIPEQNSGQVVPMMGMSNLKTAYPERYL